MIRAVAVAVALALTAAACGDDLPCVPQDGVQYLAITIDVEALPGRQTEDHVQRLIYGDFGEGHRAGIDEMMDAADAAGVKLTFFLDVVEEVIYPGQIQEVARHIVERGHDLELHAHPSAAPSSFLLGLGIPEVKQLDRFDRDEAALLFGWTSAEMAGWGVPAPVAYRAGSYRYSAGIIQALPDFGMSYSFDYNPQGVSQQDSTIGPLPMFTWENGVVEVPISFVNGGTDRFDDFNYLNGSLADAYCAIAGFERTYGRTNVLTMMMHSWSLLYDIEPFGTFVYLDDDRTHQFADFLAHLPETVRVVTARDLDALIESGDLTVSLSETTADIFGE